MSLGDLWDMVPAAWRDHVSDFATFVAGAGWVRQWLVTRKERQQHAIDRERSFREEQLRILHRLSMEIPTLFCDWALKRDVPGAKPASEAAMDAYMHSNREAWQLSSLLRGDQQISDFLSKMEQAAQRGVDARSSEERDVAVHEVSRIGWQLCVHCGAQISASMAAPNPLTKRFARRVAALFRRRVAPVQPAASQLPPETGGALQQ